MNGDWRVVIRSACGRFPPITNKSLFANHQSPRIHQSQITNHKWLPSALIGIVIALSPSVGAQWPAYSIFVTVPVTVSGWFASNSAANA
jgi:hypothetical protein